MPTKLLFPSFLPIVSTFLLCLLFIPGSAFAQRDDDTPISRIAFGSCADQHRSCPIWQTMHDYQPDLMILLGDNVYADRLDGRMVPSTPARIKEAYARLAADPGFAKLRRDIPILATWDDHDYGNNDAGVEWEHKDASAKIFHDFFGTPADSPVRQQKGVYQGKIFGSVGRRLQIIMLDTRFFRSRLTQSKIPIPGFSSLPYEPQTGPEATMLGEEQWKWLEEQLRQPADLRILASSIQILSNEHPFEKWGNFPEERERLFRLIRQTRVSGLIILSGDRHLGDISMSDQCIDYPLYDITSSGLNQARQTWRALEPNRYRIAGLPYGNHFGSLEIDWTNLPPMIKLQLRHEDGELAVQARVGLDQLQAPLPTIPLPSGVLDPARALDQNVGAKITVQFRVLSGNETANLTRIYLNSEKEYQNPRNFAILVQGESLAGPLAQARLETFLNQTIRVTGSISELNRRKQIQVTDPGQIEIVSE